MKIFILVYIHYYTSVVHYEEVCKSVSEVNKRVQDYVDSINKTIHKKCQIEQVKEFVEGEHFEIHANDYFNGGDYIISVKEVLI